MSTETIRHKEFSVVALGAREFEFKASDPTLDRMDERIRSTAWELAAFRANPMLLLQHDHAKPIGEVSQIGVDARGALVGRAVFAPEGVSEDADRACRLVKAGVLKTVSVGFRPLAYVPNGEGGVDYTSVELLEVSIVSIPAHPGAV